MSATGMRRQPLWTRLYWRFHFLATWIGGIGLLVAGGLITDVSGAATWGLFAMGIGVLLLGEISRRKRPINIALYHRTQTAAVPVIEKLGFRDARTVQPGGLLFTDREEGLERQHAPAGASARLCLRLACDWADIDAYELEKGQQDAQRAWRIPADFVNERLFEVRELKS